MKRYNITVNGKSYDVAVEEIGGQSSPAESAPARAVPSAPSAPSAPAAQAAVSTPTAAAPAAYPAPRTACPPDSSGVAGATTIKAPMPGTVLSFCVDQDQVVKRGEVILILEAMKMENEIVATEDGTIAAFRVAPGAAVNTGDALVDLT